MEWGGKWWYIISTFDNDFFFFLAGKHFYDVGSDIYNNKIRQVNQIMAVIICIYAPGQTSSLSFLSS